MAEILVAIAGGHFKAQGLDVQFIPGASSPQAVQQVIAGQALVGRTAGITHLSAVAKGGAIRAIGTADQDKKETLKLIRTFPIEGASDDALTTEILDANQELWLSAGADNILRNVPENWAKGVDLAVRIALGILFGKLVWLEQALQPVIVAIQVAPKIALVPLFIVWFGFGIGAKVVIAAVLAFLPIMSNTILGVKSIERGHREVMTTLRARRVARLMLLDLPSALPYVLTGMEVGIILAMIGAVVGEFLAGADGLGHMAVAALNGFEVDVLFAVIVILAAALYLAVALLRRFFIPWHAAANTTL